MKDLAGRLQSVAFRHGIRGKGGMPEDFDAAQHRLEPLRIEVFCGLVFGTFSDATVPVEDYLGDTMARMIRRNPGRPQQRVAAPCHLGVGVLDRRHHAGDPGRDDGLGAGRRLAMMGARLERRVERRPARRRAGAPQRLGFRVGAPARLGPAAADDDTAVAIVARLNKAPPARLDWAFTGRDQFRDPNGTPNLDALQGNLQKQKQVGFLKDDIDVRKYSDLSIVEEAANRLK